MITKTKDDLCNQELISGYEKYNRELKREMFKLWELINSGDYFEGEIEDHFSEIVTRFYPEEFID